MNLDSDVFVYVSLSCCSPENFCVAPGIVKLRCLIWSSLVLAAEYRLSGGTIVHTMSSNGYLDR